ncbi:hypothetical protein [Metabacillus sp. 84]|uniref:hypothetical protein n=1 Tax=unclassified Metabacillus TaxID=2675274 RepID=UPI003CEAB952
MNYGAGDILIQIFSFSLLFFAAAVIVRFFPSSSRSKRQLDRLDMKLDEQHRQKEKNRQIRSS